jgi:hypothetical protein
MKKLILSALLMSVMGVFLYAQQPSVLYFDFEDGKAPAFTNAGGSWEGIVVNPAKAGVNTSDSVGSTLTGPNAWDGIQINLGGFVDLRAENKFSMKVYHPTLQGETRLHFKGAKELKLDVMYTTPGEWAEITWEVPAADDGLYNQVLLCFAHERAESDELWLFDDLRGTPVYTPPQPNVYYSTVNHRKDWTGFDAATYEVVQNPAPSMENDNPYTAKSLTGTTSWAGIYYDLAGPIDFSETQLFTIKVLSDSIGDVRLQLEGTGGVEKLKITVPYTTPGEWKMLTFDPANATSGNTSIVYNRIVVIFDDKDTDAGEEWYFDDIRGPVLDIGDIDPVRTYFDFDTKKTENDFFAFQSAVFSGVVENPMKDAVNGSDSVGLFFTGTDTWSGIAYDLPNTIDFSEGTIFKMMVHSDSAGVVRFQLEQRGNGNSSDRVRVLVNYDTPGEWAEMTFDAKNSDLVGPTGEKFNRIVLIFDASDKDLGEQWYFDDLTGPGLTPVYYSDGIFRVTNMNTPSTSYAIQINNGDAITLYNDGTMGDEVADDNIWSVMVPNLPVGDHVMDVWADGVPISSADDVPFTITESLAADTIAYSHDMTSVDQREPGSFVMYPNPATDQVTLNAESTMFKEITVYNILGAEVRHLNSLRDSEVTINLDSVDSGIYLIRTLDHEGKTEILKLIKK